MVGERGLRAPAGRALRAVAFATLSRCARRNPPSEVLTLFYSGEKKPVLADRFLKMVGERGLRAPAGRALRAVAFATLSRCARRNPPSEVLTLFYSGEKKPVLADRFLKMVGERGLRAPAGRALRAVAFATLSRCARRNPPSEVLILFYSGEKKPVFADRFLKYGRRERIRTSDPLVPNQLRYQAALLADFLFCFAWCEERDLNPHVR